MLRFRMENRVFSGPVFRKLFVLPVTEKTQFVLGYEKIKRLYHQHSPVNNAIIFLVNIFENFLF